MNILPKKRWHVRTKENIARVRRDEAEAAAKEQQEKLRIDNADREARLNILKLKSKQKLGNIDIVETEPGETSVVSEHINLFDDLSHAVKTTNKDHDKDVKEKTEEYEKKIGYLTYLGQDTNEALKKKNWYEVPPEASRFTRSNDIKDTYEKLVLKDQDGKPKSEISDEKNGEISWKAKQLLDPINHFKQYCQKAKSAIQNQTGLQKVHNASLKKEKDGKHKKNEKEKSNDKNDKLQKLREARLKRERQEKIRTDQFLTELNAPVKTSESNIDCDTRVKPKYNSQFNPELARQNYR